MDKKEALLCSKICRLTYVSEYKFKNFQLSARFENKGTDTQGLFGVEKEKPEASRQQYLAVLQTLQAIR